MTSSPKQEQRQTSASEVSACSDKGANGNSFGISDRQTSEPKSKKEYKTENGGFLTVSSAKKKNTIFPCNTVLPGEAMPTSARLASQRGEFVSFEADVPQLEDVPTIAELAFEAYDKKYHHAGLK